MESRHETCKILLLLLAPAAANSARQNRPEKSPTTAKRLTVGDFNASQGLPLYQVYLLPIQVCERRAAVCAGRRRCHGDPPSIVARVIKTSRCRLHSDFNFLKVYDHELLMDFLHDASEWNIWVRLLLLLAITNRNHPGRDERVYLIS